MSNIPFNIRPVRGDMADLLAEQQAAAPVSDATVAALGDKAGDSHNHDSRYISRDNIGAFTPAADYHPATKKYVDDNSGGGGAAAYMYPVWAEENAALGNPAYEWAFGNGANTPIDGGMTVYVPSGYTCAVVAMSLRVGGGTATVELLKNGTLQGANCRVVLSNGQSATDEIGSPISIANNDYINFRTTTSSGTSGPCVVTAWLKMTPT